MELLQKKALGYGIRREVLPLRVTED